MRINLNASTAKRGKNKDLKFSLKDGGSAGGTVGYNANLNNIWQYLVVSLIEFSAVMNQDFERRIVLLGWSCFILCEKKQKRPTNKL